MKVKGKHAVLALVCIVLGFLLAYSYQLTKNETKNPSFSGEEWQTKLNLRNQIIEQEVANRNLQNELTKKQQLVLEKEKELSKEAQSLYNIAEDTEKYRLFLGKVKVKGPGVEITLADGDYDPDDKNVNNYLVHEQHVFKVVNELKIAGASAIAINGQRLSSNSYILCEGPVITVDEVQHPAPFVITAIGDSDVLSSAVNLTGGVKDQLINDNITVKIEKKVSVVMNPILGK